MKLHMQQTCQTNVFLRLCINRLCSNIHHNKAEIPLPILILHSKSRPYTVPVVLAFCINVGRRCFIKIEVFWKHQRFLYLALGSFELPPAVTSSFPILNNCGISTHSSWVCFVLGWTNQSAVDWRACELYLNSVSTLVSEIPLGWESSFGFSRGYIYLWASKVFGTVCFLVHCSVDCL